jgi:lipoprotein-releasing system permease protein
MLSRTSIKIALVHLSSRAKQTVVAVLSVVFGVSTYVFMNSFMAGVNDTQADLAFSTLAHVRISNDPSDWRTQPAIDAAPSDTLVVVRNARSTHYTTGIKNSAGVIQAIDGEPGIVAVAPQVNLSATFHRGTIRINGVVSGVDPDDENRVFGTSQYVDAGRWDDLRHRANGMIIGKTLASNLGADLGNQVQIRTLEGQMRSFEVIGIIEVGVTGVDAQKAFINIGTARRILAANASYVTDLQLGLTDYDDARNVARRVADIVPYYVETWQDASGQLEVGNTLRNIIALAVSLSLLTVAGFGIYNIMNMTVNEKMRQIAILMAMGFQRGDIVTVFLVQSLIIGVFGGVFGVTFGFALSIIVDQIPFPIAALDTYPITYSSVDYVVSFLCGLITTFLAGFLPAWRAAQVDPIAIIRG